MGHRSENKSNPMRDVTRYITWEKAKEFVNSFDEPKYRLFFRLLLITGRRLGEVLKLRVWDIDFENGEITWHIEKKGGDVRAILPVKDDILQELASYIEKENRVEDEYVFRSPVKEGNNPLSRQRIWQVFNMHAKKTGVMTKGGNIPRVHDLRHTVAVRLADYTRDIRVVKKQLQHSNVAISSQYLNISVSDLREKTEEALE